MPSSASNDVDRYLELKHYPASGSHARFLSGVRMLRGISLTGWLFSAMTLLRAWMDSDPLYDFR
jgi:hypothetical protein